MLNEIEINDQERLDVVNDNIKLIQRKKGLTFGTDALLLAGYITGKHRVGAELGGGSGIISMLLLSREKVETATAYEVQKEYADLIKRNAEENRLSQRLSSVCIDVRDLPTLENFDIVFTNPPYMKSDGGANNKEDKKSIARHEIFGNIEDFCASAKRLLKYGGLFYAVYRPDRLADIIVAMRKHGLEPKRITFVHADTRSESSMVLIEAKRGGKSGIQLTRPLIIYKDFSHKEYGEDMNYIMENGSFPPEYRR